jgi:hypothetical protein
MRRAAAVLAALALSGCADADGPESPSAGPSPGFEVEGSGTEPAGPVVDPSMVLVRDARTVEAAAANAPAEGAAEVIRSWDRWDERALIAVYGGTVPDGGHSVRVDGVALNEDGRHLTVSGSLVAEDPAIQVVSIAWAVVSVDADLVARAELCALALEGREALDAACSPAIPYASK